MGVHGARVEVEAVYGSHGQGGGSEEAIGGGEEHGQDG
jgi:hypothetical protein